MDRKLERALDSCLARMKRGESIAACVSDYPELQTELEPLLEMANEMSHGAEASPPPDFHAASRARLLSRIRSLPQEGSLSAGPSGSHAYRANGLREWFDRVGISSRRFLVPAGAFAAVLVAAAVLVNPWVSQTQLATACTLSNTEGAVEIRHSDTDAWASATDGDVLSIGSRLRTGDGARALLTLFEGSTVELLPGTELEVQQARVDDEGQNSILFSQFSGKTWNRVMSLIDLRSSYEVRTPSAYCLVTGTYFLVSVDETNSTTVEVEEGTVAVGAEGVEVTVDAGQQVIARPGEAPGQPCDRGQGGEIAPEEAATEEGEGEVEEEVAPTPSEDRDEEEDEEDQEEEEEEEEEEDEEEEEEEEEGKEEEEEEED